MQQSIYNKEQDVWMRQVLAYMVILIPIGFFLAGLVWQMLYKPITKFNKEIKWIEQGNFSTEIQSTNIYEFDQLMEQFQNMKVQILELLGAVESKEKMRADMEIQKMLYQINPHFLMNTLNSIHWMAVEAKQIDIDRSVMALNKLLRYNLGKDGEYATIEQEMDTVRQYLILQQNRYDFVYEMEADPEILQTKMPRFILQPIIENAIYHGLDDTDTIIKVKVSKQDTIRIEIEDSGKGMDPVTLQDILNGTRKKDQSNGLRMGIGMRYVQLVLESYYEGKAKCMIQSELGKGTWICLELPLIE